MPNHIIKLGQRINVKIPLFLWVVFFSPAVHSQDFALPPHLFNLYHAYPSLHQQLSRYATTQGFTQPHEHLATILHELIHIDSAAHQAFVINGQNFAPYNQPSAWPTYNFSDFRKTRSNNHIAGLQKSTENPIYHQYIINAPQNTLANLADELNAYTQTAQWLCETAPKTEQTKTVNSFTHLYQVTHAYLKALQTDAPAQYQAFLTKQHQARKLLELVLIKARGVLALCATTPLDDG